MDRGVSPPRAPTLSQNKRLSRGSLDAHLLPKDRLDNHLNPIISLNSKSTFPNKFFGAARTLKSNPSVSN